MRRDFLFNIGASAKRLNFILLNTKDVDPRKVSMRTKIHLIYLCIHFETKNIKVSHFGRDSMVWFLIFYVRYHSQRLSTLTICKVDNSKDCLRKYSKSVHSNIIGFHFRKPSACEFLESHSNTTKCFASATRWRNSSSWDKRLSLLFYRAISQFQMTSHFSFANRLPWAIFLSMALQVLKNFQMPISCCFV